MLSFRVSRNAPAPSTVTKFKTGDICTFSVLVFTVIYPDMLGEIVNYNKLIAFTFWGLQFQISLPSIITNSSLLLGVSLTLKISRRYSLDHI